MVEQGEFEKRIRQHCEFPKSFKISTVDTVEEATEEEIQKLLKIVDDAKKGILDYFRRGLFHEGLTKWFGDNNEERVNK